jgi:hypothetical protein
LETQAVVEDKQPYTIQQLMVLHGLSYMTVQRIYEKEHGVLIHHPETRPSGRRYRLIRVPRHVYRRVCQRMEVK